MFRDFRSIRDHRITKESWDTISKAWLPLGCRLAGFNCSSFHSVPALGSRPWFRQCLSRRSNCQSEGYCRVSPGPGYSINRVPRAIGGTRNGLVRTASKLCCLTPHDFLPQKQQYLWVTVHLIRTDFEGCLLVLKYQERRSKPLDIRVALKRHGSQDILQRTSRFGLWHHAARIGEALTARGSWNRRPDVTSAEACLVWNRAGSEVDHYMSDISLQYTTIIYNIL